jgi:hypothetical protein
MAGFVTVLSTLNVSMAYLARAQLEDAGIPCYLANEHQVALGVRYSNLLGGIEVKVPEPEAARALALLQEEYIPEAKSPVATDALTGSSTSSPADPLPPPPEAFLSDIACPRCQSPRLECKQSPRLLPMLLACLASIYAPTTYKRRYTCLNCGLKWKD